MGKNLALRLVFAICCTVGIEGCTGSAQDIDVESEAIGTSCGEYIPTITLWDQTGYTGRSITLCGNGTQDLNSTVRYCNPLGCHYWAGAVRSWSTTGTGGTFYGSVSNSGTGGCFEWLFEGSGQSTADSCYQTIDTVYLSL